MWLKTASNTGAYFVGGENGCSGSTAAAAAPVTVGVVVVVEVAATDAVVNDGTSWNDLRRIPSTEEPETGEFGADAFALLVC